MRFSKSLAGVLLIVILPTIQAFAGDFEIIFGLMEKDSSGRYFVASETRTIPLIFKDKDPDFRFGYSIKAASGQAFSTYFIMRAPSAFETYTGEMKEATRKEESKTVQSQPKKTTGWLTQTFRFDRGDPSGRYQIDIWVNDKLVKTIDFTVVKAK